MKRCFQIIFLITLAFLYHCVPKPVEIPPAWVDEGQGMFEEAERYFQNKDYQKALETLSAFLEKYPRHELKPAAFLKIGDIYSFLGETEKARDAYSRLISQYPQSPFVPNAQLGILETRFEEGAYAEVIDQAAGIPEDTLSRSDATRFFVLLGDSHKAIGAFEDAVYHYAKAFDNAEAQEKETIASKIQEAIPELKADEIATILGRLADAASSGYLLYQLSLLRAKQQQYDEAIKFLDRLVETFPDHEYAAQAEILRDEYKELSLYWSTKGPMYRRYTIGCLLPLSGPYAEFGTRALKGIELALNQFSTKETTPTFEIVIKDTASDPDRTLRAVEELVEENVAAIIGPIATAVAAAFEAQDREIPIITLTQKDNITVVGDYVFRNFLTPRMQVEIIVSYAVNELGLNRFAILYPEEPYGKTYMNLFWDEILLYGGKVMGIEAYDPTQTDFADPIRKLVGLYYEIPKDLKEEPDVFREKENPEEEPEPIIDFHAIFIPDAPQKAGLVIPQLAYHDVVDVYLMGTNLWHSDKLIKMAKQHVQGATMVDGFFAESRSDTVRRFTNTFRNTYRQQPGFIEAIAYDTAMILFDMINRPEIVSRRMIKDALLNLKDYSGITGQTSFTEDGDCKKRLYLLRVKGDRFVEVEY
jgi:ABC-type branched-subunit amino acid transport system substrate-binding protein